MLTITCKAFMYTSVQFGLSISVASFSLKIHRSQNMYRVQQSASAETAHHSPQISIYR